MPRIEAVLFDLDDTLYPERQYVESGFAAVAAWLTPATETADALSDAMLTALDRDGRGGVFDATLERLGLDVRLVPTLVHVYRTHLPRIVLFADVAPTLARLRGEGRKLAIVTDGASAMQTRKIGALGLETWVDVVVATDDLLDRRGKPDPQGLRVALDRLRVAPQAALYVGDDPSKDFLGARTLGLGTLHLDRDLAHPLRRPGPWPEGYAADASSRDLRGLIQHLERLETPA